MLILWIWNAAYSAWHKKKWHMEPKECADLFKQYKIFDFIEDCYDSLHLSGYQCALDDIQTLLSNQGVVV